MKKKLYIGLLALEALICLGLVLAQKSSATPSLFAFPLGLMAQGLRQLSLSGAAGNLAAWFIYILVCISPLLLFLHRGKKLPEDGLIPVISLVCFAALYFLMNPTLLGEVFTSVHPSSQAFLVSPVWGLLLAYGLLRLRRWLSDTDISGLTAALSFCLALIGAIFIAAIFYGCPSAALTQISALQEANTALLEHQLLPTQFFILLQSIVQGLPYVLDMIILFSSFTLLDALRKDPYAPSTQQAAQKLGKICGGCLPVAALAHSAVQLLQLLFAKDLYQLNAITEIPLISLAFMAAILLLARFIEKSRVLKEENDSFI